MRSLAIEGGKPVRSKVLPYGRQCIGEEDIEAVVRVLRSDWLTTGPNVAEFENAFAGRVGVQHAVAVSNGTAALHGAISVVKIGPGDEVIVPALTFAATANCVQYVGGKVVFADVRPDTLNVDVELVKAAISPRTRAIITVDFAGLPSDLDEIRALAARHDLSLIEDGCHALGATYRGKPVGGLADLTAFSLHPVKHVTTGEGGVITTNDALAAERLRRFRNHGIATDHRQREAMGSWFYEMVELGYNYRLTDFQCALGRSQLGKLDAWIERRRAVAEQYSAAFADWPELETPCVLPDRQSAWHLYPVRLNLNLLSVGRDQIFRALRAENIGVNVHYIPVPWHPYYQALGYSRGQWPVAEGAYERLLSLPMFSSMSQADIDDVIAAMRKVLKAYRR